MDIDLSLVPVECFLHRIFPVGHYTEIADEIVELRSFRPRKDCQNYILKFPLDWEAFEFAEDRNWRMQLQGWTFFHPIMNFFDEYHDQRSVLDYFFELAHDWWDNYGNDPDDIVTSRMPDSYAWYDMSVGFRALVIAFFINRIRFYNIYVPREEMEFLDAMAAKHMKHLSLEEVFSLNNHGLFQIHGMMALLNVRLGLPCQSLADYALRKMEDLLSAQFDNNGIHLEHSPHYHFYALSVFECIVASGWYGDSEVFLNAISKAKGRLKWLVDPLKRPVCVGDSILTRQSRVSFPCGSDGVLVSDFANSGYAVVRSAWGLDPSSSSMLFMTGGYHSKSHKHRDCLSFEWFDRGGKIICDSGKYGYRNDKYRRYFLSNRAHNTVEIDGFDILKLKPYGSALKVVDSDVAGVYRLSGVLSYKAIYFKRDVYYKPGDWVVVCDDLSFVRSRSYVQWFHLEKEYSLVSSVGGVLSFKASEGRELLVQNIRGDVDCRLHRGDEKTMQGFVSENDNHYNPASVVGFEGCGDKAELLTVLALGAGELADASSFATSLFGGSISSSRKCDLDLIKLLPNVPHMSGLDIKCGSLVGDRFTFSSEVSGVIFHGYCHVKSSEKLLVLLPGASNRAKGAIDFQRFSWSGDFAEHDVLCVSDPSLSLDQDLSLAWFQYTKENYGISALSDLVREVVSRFGYLERDVTFLGSSGGGYVGLKLASEFPESNVVSINPQLFLYKYNKSHYDKMLSCCYPGMTDVEVSREYLERLVVDVDLEFRKGKIYVYHNLQDVKHINKHLNPYLKNLDESFYRKSFLEGFSLKGGIPDVPLNVFYYDDVESGHRPPGKEQTMEMIAPVL
jgi:hypothetical protein